MTPEQVKERFQKEGKSYSDWAREHKFDPKTVIAVLNGVNKGRRGKAHDVAVALGLK
ncbi:MAG: DNA-binding protein [Methylobacter tundripaludum]|nr:DNA-binding protein [Methylobacter tundripaludum]